MTKNQIKDTEFRGFPDGYQRRRQLCKEFSRLLASDIDALVIDVRPGIGATSICAEYLEDLDEPGILLTVHAGSRAGYSISYLLEQALRQAYSLLGETPKQSAFENLTSEWHKTLTKLQRRVKSTRQRLHLIIDGLYQIPSDDERYLQDVVRDVLFLGNPDVKHVITWKEGPGLPSFFSKVTVRRANLPPLSEIEASQFLAVNSISESWKTEIIASTGCVPAKLSSVVRLHKLGVLDKLRLSDSLAAYYELEWDALFPSLTVPKEVIETAFAFLVYSKRPLKLGELAHYCQIEANAQLREILAKSGFVRVGLDEYVHFGSNTHRDFISTKLAHRRTAILSGFVDALAQDATSVDSVQLLPSYYEELGRNSEIISSLTIQNLDSYLASTQSLTSLRRRNELGFLAASRCSQEIDAYRFAIQTSVVRSLEGHSGNEARLAALAAIGRFEEALNLAQSEPTKEQRLLLLAQYAQALFSQGLKVDKVIEEGISSLLNDIDLAGNKDRAMQIAESLVGPFPDLSISLVEIASEGAKDFQDASFAHLAFKAQRDASNKKGGGSSSRIYAGKIADSTLQGFVRAAESVFSTKSPEEVKLATAGLDGRQRSFFLRQWLRANSNDLGALDLADYALDEVARDSSYLPTASDLREICVPVSSATDKDKAAAVLSRVEVQRSALLDATPTVDRLRLDLEIARGKCALSLAKHDDVLSELYLRVGYLEDDGVKLECFCWMRSELDHFNAAPLSVMESFRNLFDEGINQTIEKCLSTTAEHLDVFKGAVSALAEFSPIEAVTLIGKLNTQDRRDEAYAVFSERLLTRRSSAPIPNALLLKVMNSITADEVRWPAIVSCLRILAKSSPSLEQPPLGLIALGRSIGDSLGRAYAIISAVTVAKNYSLNLKTPELITEFDETVERVDQVWRVAELRYRFVEALSKTDLEVASSKLSQYQAQGGPTNHVTPDFARLLIELCRFTVIAFAGNLKHRLDTDESIESTLTVVSLSPSVVEQVRLLTDLIMRAYSSHRSDVVSKVCEYHVMPIIRNHSGGGAYLRQRITTEAFPGLFLWNQAVARSLISDWPREVQDSCKSDVIHYYVTGNTIQEPYSDSTFKGSRITWATALTIVQLIEELTVDNVMVMSIETFVKSALSKSSINEINSSQRASLAGRLLTKIDRDLPDRNNIAHLGWQVVARAYCFLLMGEGTPRKWDKLLADARAIPNASDRVYVMTAVASCLLPKFASLKSELIRDAEAALKSIPSRIDAIRRAVSISNASTSSEMDDAIAKRLLTQAMKDSLLLKDQESASETQRTIIDQAYKVEKSFAEELVKLVDSDPARHRARHVVKASLATQKTRGALLAKRYGEVDENLEEIGSISWKMLGDLNSGTLPPEKQDELGKLLSKVYRCTVEEAGGFYWWYLRNLQVKYAHSLPQSRAVLIPLFEVTRLAAMLTHRIGRRICGGAELLFSQDSSRGSNLVVGPGSRGDAMDFIKRWIDEQLGSEVLICDPYFKFDNIDFVRDLSFHKSGLEFEILTCASDESTGDLESLYGSAWARIAHVQPPPLRAVHVTYEGDRSVSPIHDRWLFCGQAGLRIGTSVGSFGISRISEISTVTEVEAQAIRSALQPFVDLRERTLEGRRLKYKVVQW